MAGTAGSTTTIPPTTEAPTAAAPPPPLPPAPAPAGGSTTDRLTRVLLADAAASVVPLTDEEARCLAGALVDLLGEEAVGAALDSGTEPDVDSIMATDPQAALDFLDQVVACAPRFAQGL